MNINMAWFLVTMGFFAVLLLLMLLHVELRRISGIVEAHLELHDRRERLYEDELKQRS